jgi:predicted AlkP superfamily phosphohydrolase/phosphomutase
MDRLFFINNWLKGKGLLKTKKINNIMTFYDLAQGSLFGRPAIKWARNLLSFVNRNNRRINFKSVISPAMLYNKEKTAAFAVKASSYAGIFITAENDDHAVRLRNSIKKELSEMIDLEKNKKVIKNIYCKEDIYKGNQSDKLPDLIVEPEKGYVMETKIIKNTLFSDPYSKHLGIHTRDGIIVAAGKNIKKGRLENDHSIVDMAASIIHLMGFPVPDGLDGDVIWGIFDEDFKSKAEKTVKIIPKDNNRSDFKGYSREESNEVYARLRDLGYLD